LARHTNGRWFCAAADRLTSPTAPFDLIEVATVSWSPARYGARCAGDRFDWSGRVRDFVASVDELVALFDSSALLRLIPTTIRVQLVEKSSRQVVRAGQRLYGVGDVSESLAMVIVGRLEVCRNGVTLTDLTRGQVVGELGVLTGELRSADVVAARDSEVLVMPAVEVVAALRAHPDAALAAAAAVAMLVREPPARKKAVSVVALCAASPAVDVDALAQRLAAAVNATVCAGEIDEVSLMQLIARIDTDAGLLILVARRHNQQWRAACERQADVVLQAVDSDDIACGLNGGSRSELVVVHRAGRQPRGTAQWLNGSSMARHHVRDGDRHDIARLVRRLTGRSVGLALSGGGVRGLAHLGAYRALVEGGVPIDMVAGASIGAVVAAQVATMADPMELIARNSASFKKADFGRRLTLPVVSLLSIRHALVLFEELFGDRDLADTVVPCSVSVANFTTCELELPDTGPAALWTRASASPPGLWPPVAHNGQLYVDGGILDNLPVDALRARGASKVLSIRVSKVDSMVAPRRGRSVTSWRQVIDPRPSRRVADFPSLSKTMFRLGALSSVGRQFAALAASDVVVEPAVAHMGLGQYQLADRAIDLGYQAMRQALDDHGDELMSWR
jgi:NTE family protein